MKKGKKHFSATIAISTALAIVLVISSTVIAAAAEPSGSDEALAGTPSHAKIDISDITGEMAEPPELTSAASALAGQKQWYEYIYYSREPVGYYYLSDNTRIAFYDPYDYSNSLVMEVDDSITDWSSNNSLQVSYTTGNSMSRTDGQSTNTTTSVQIVNGQDKSVSHQDEPNKATTTSEGRIETYNNSKQYAYTDTHDGWGTNETTSADGGISAGMPGVEVDFSMNKSWEKSTNHSSDYHGENTTEDNGHTEDNTTKTTYTDVKDSTVTSTIADRVTKATGGSASTSITMSTNNSTTITKTYDAAYFNENGAPLQWKIIKYTVMMPMKMQVEYLIDGEWIFGCVDYCVLNTIQGTCRAWLQNNTAYYEHWGTGEPVTWDEFWSTFFTKDSLINAYQNRLYPN